MCGGGVVEVWWRRGKENESNKRSAQETGWKNVHFYEMDIHLFKQTVIKCHFLIIKSDWIRDFSFKMKSIKIFFDSQIKKFKKFQIFLPLILEPR